MGIRITKNNDTVLPGVKEYFCDTEADVKFLPKDAEVGSAALVIETGEVYLINTKGKWKKV